MIKKLFELEVPEIFEGIVEIKSIARLPGERTKIAVWSKNEKVDSVGACVGMRGNRVRNIVNELQGEKIDIVRYNDDIKEYIKNALSPAKIGEIKLEKENQKATVLVDDDQLSLAIGKHGQNVRLASKLIGWELDIRTKSQAAAEMLGGIGKTAEEGQVAEEAVGEVAHEEKSVQQLEGVGEKTLDLLQKAGFNTVESIANAGVEDLTAIKGIGEKKAEKIIESAKKLIA